MTEGEIGTVNPRKCFFHKRSTGIPLNVIDKEPVFSVENSIRDWTPRGNRGKVSKALQGQALKTGTSTETWHPSCSHREAELMRCGLIRAFKLKSAFKHTPELRKIYLVFYEKLTVRGSQDVWTL
jgi:hypothetical protein